MAADEIQRLLLQRNAFETIPFISVLESNASLQNQVDALHSKCEALERDIASQQQQLEEAAVTSPLGKGASAAIRNEARLRDKLEKLQEEFNDKLKQYSEQQANALATSKELSAMKDLNTAQEATISNLKQENDRSEVLIEHLTIELNDAKSRTKLAEQQYMGLKETIRTLQEENDVLKKENQDLEDRMVGDKEKLSDEVNVLNDMVQALKKEVDMLRSLKVQEDKRKSWFLRGSSEDKKDEESLAKATPERGDSTGRKWGSMGVVLPSGPKLKIQAHSAEATCVRYDASGTDLIATASSDSTVKVWDASSGMLRSTLRGGSGHTIISCDISGSVVVGAGSDKTCRVWNLRTERMLHQLVGHAHKITCVRLFGGERAVLTASADRSLKVWDISAKTYRQTTTLRHGSTCNCVDVWSDSFTAVSGHMDGGLRFWDLRTGDRTTDVCDLHEGGVTSVQFHPTNHSHVLTNGKDSSLKLIDIRTGTTINTYRHPEFQTSFTWSAAALSPNGAYAAAGSGTNGQIFVWRVEDGKLEKKLSGHESGVSGFAWGRGGSSGQQVASVDRKGTLVLWA